MVIIGLRNSPQIAVIIPLTTYVGTFLSWFVGHSTSMFSMILQLLIHIVSRHGHKKVILDSHLDCGVHIYMYDAALRHRGTKDDTICTKSSNRDRESSMLYRISNAETLGSISFRLSNTKSPKVLRSFLRHCRFTSTLLKMA